jgi:hypothetical protein
MNMNPIIALRTLASVVVYLLLCDSGSASVVSLQIARIDCFQQVSPSPDEISKKKYLEESLEKLRKAERAPRDYSMTPTEDLLRLALDIVQSDKSYKAALEELSRRPDETKALIRNFLQKEIPTDSDITSFTMLPRVANLFGTEYKVQITKEILFHPLFKNYDLKLVYFHNPEIIGDLGSSTHDETPVLDRLIADGRLERGSEAEKHWRKLLSGGKRDRNHEARQESVNQNSTVSTPLTTVSENQIANKTSLFLLICVLLPVLWIVSKYIFKKLR